MACEPVTEVVKLAPLRDWIDIVGLDYYPHFHGRRPLRSYLKLAQKQLDLPIALTEFGVPEGYQIGTGKVDLSLQFAPGHDVLRTQIAGDLLTILRRAKDEGVEIEAAGWYPFIDNFWTKGLTRQPPGEGDRAGLIDFSRGENGELRRVPCENLILELGKIKEL